MEKKRNVLRELGLMFLIGFVILTCFHYVSALDSLGTFKQGQQVRISQVCSDATYINISSISYPNSSVAVSGIEMTSAGSGEFYYDFNFTDTNGKYDVRGVSDGCEGTFVTYFEITLDGQDPALSNSNFYILAFFIVLFLLFIYIHNSVDLDSWYKRILTRYETKNYFKLVMSSIGYNIMANGFALFYILGMPIVMLVSNIISVNNITPLLWFSENLLWVYAWASILVFISIVGKAQEFIVELLKDIDNSLWGFGNDK
jgi:hypothetical protein